MSSLIKVKGFRNVIHWRVTRYDEPKEIELVGRGRPAIRIALRLCVKDNKPGSTVPGRRRPDRRPAEHPGRQPGRQGAGVRRAQVGGEARGAALTPLVVHGTRFVPRLDGFDTLASADGSTRSAPSPAPRSPRRRGRSRRSCSPAAGHPEWCGRAAPRPARPRSSFRWFWRSRSCSWPRRFHRRRPR